MKSPGESGLHRETIKRAEKRGLISSLRDGIGWRRYSPRRCGSFKAIIPARATTTPAGGSAGRVAKKKGRGESNRTRHRPLKRKPMSDPYQIPDIASIQRRFFSTFLAGTSGELELRRMTFDPTLGERGRYTAPESIVSRDMETLLAFSTNGGGDIFHGINSRKPGIVNAEKKDIAEVVCIGGDVDFKTTSKEVFERNLLKFPHPPTGIVDSGNGRHLYWLLKAPLVVEGAEQIELAEGISKGIARRLGGDSTYDVTRILRTPGRPNSKYDHKPLCRILKDGGPRYDINELEQYWENPSGAKQESGDRRHSTGVTGKIHGLARQASDYWRDMEGGAQRPNRPKRERI